MSPYKLTKVIPPKIAVAVALLPNECRNDEAAYEQAAKQIIRNHLNDPITESCFFEVRCPRLSKWIEEVLAGN